MNTIINRGDPICPFVTQKSLNGHSAYGSIWMIEFSEQGINITFTALISTLKNTEGGT